MLGRIATRLWSRRASGAAGFARSSSGRRRSSTGTWTCGTTQKWTPTPPCASATFATFLAALLRATTTTTTTTRVTTAATRKHRATPRTTTGSTLPMPRLTARRSCGAASRTTPQARARLAAKPLRRLCSGSRGSFAPLTPASTPESPACPRPEIRASPLLATTGWCSGSSRCGRCCWRWCSSSAPSWQGRSCTVTATRRLAWPRPTWPPPGGAPRSRQRPMTPGQGGGRNVLTTRLSRSSCDAHPAASRVAAAVRGRGFKGIASDSWPGAAGTRARRRPASLASVRVCACVCVSMCVCSSECALRSFARLGEG
mmetsp:Transcript_15772/g.59792  ORF Transcript_15772/g.59792 Transcript_15772/m.59792 type:complete len:314 (+) Transcript_15772:275-1216(+)